MADGAIEIELRSVSSGQVVGSVPSPDGWSRVLDARGSWDPGTGDGVIHVAVRERGPTTSLYRLALDGVGQRIAGSLVWPKNMYLTRAGDLDGDGVSDFLVNSQWPFSSGEGRVGVTALGGADGRELWFLDNEGMDSTPTWAAAVPLADVDDDGIPDFLVETLRYGRSAGSDRTEETLEHGIVGSDRRSCQGHSAASRSVEV